MERASIARYCAPCLCRVSAMVANAIVGAAAKTPAKLFGLNKSPMTEKMLTTRAANQKANKDLHLLPHIAAITCPGICARSRVQDLR